MTEVHIVYTGVISFYPSKENGEIKTLWVLAPNGEHPGHRHQLWMACRKNQVRNADGFDVLVEERLPGEAGQSAVAFAIDGPMEIEGMPDQELEIDEGELESQLVPLSHLRCHHLFGEDSKAKLLSHHLSQIYKKRTSFRTAIKNGKVECCYVDYQKEWRFSNDLSEGNSFFLAQEVCHTFDVEGETLTLSFQGRRVELGVESELESIIIKIGNTLPMDVLRPLSEPSGVDFHVQLFDKLASSPGGSLPYLMRAEEKPEGPMSSSEQEEEHDHGWANAMSWVGGVEFGMAVGGANCPPGWWEEDDGG